MQKKLKIMKAVKLQLITLITNIFLFSNCNEKIEKHENHSVDTNRVMISINDRLSNVDLEKAEKDILTNGDTSAYLDLRIEYLDLPPEELLPYANVMADKYNFPLACFDIYTYIEIKHNLIGAKLSKELIGEADYDLAIKHLIKGAELGDKQCMSTIDEYYPELRIKK